MFQAFNEFLSGAMTIEGLSYCLSKVNLGHQYVFKNNKACRQIKYLEIKRLNKQEYDNLIIYHNDIKVEKENVIEYAKEKYEIGTRIQSLLRRYQ